MPEPAKQLPAPSLDSGDAPTNGLLHPSRLRNAAVWRFAYLGLQGGLSLALFIALGQILPADAFSVAAVALGVLVIAQTLGDFGLSQALSTDLPARVARTTARDGAAAADRLYATGAYAVVLATLAAFALCAGGAILVPQAATASVLLVAPAAAAGMAVSGADGLLRSTGDFRRPVMLVALSRGAYFAGLPVAAITESSDWTCAAIAAGGLTGSLPVAAYLFHLTRAYPRDSVGEVFRASVPLGISQLFVVAGGRIDTVILAAVSTLSTAAAFEGVWRLHQVGQYVAGGVATTLAPFLGTMIGESNFDELRKVVRRGVLVTGIAGVIWGASVYIFRDLIGKVLMPELGDDVGEALAVFAVLAPLTYVGFICTMTLAPSPSERPYIVAFHALGAIVNLVLLFMLADSEGLRGAALACGLGLAVTNLGMIVRCAAFLERLK